MHPHWCMTNDSSSPSHVFMQCCIHPLGGSKVTQTLKNIDGCWLCGMASSSPLFFREHRLILSFLLDQVYIKTEKKLNLLRTLVSGASLQRDRWCHIISKASAALREEKKKKNKRLKSQERMQFTGGHWVRKRETVDESVILLIVSFCSTLVLL